MKDKYANLTRDSRDHALNDFSYWFPKVKDCGMHVPPSVVVKTPQHLIDNGTFCLDNNAKDTADIQAWVDGEIIPAIKSAGLEYLPLFVKNASFSGKFDANENCFAMKENLTEHIKSIMYNDLSVGVDGFSEIVIRQRIRFNPKTTPCIYNGLPLRPEFRVFYDFDEKSVIFVANYWAYAYCFDGLFFLTDQIIFNHMRGELERVFAEYKDFVAQKVAWHMKNVSGLSGAWSVDIMFADYPQPGEEDPTMFLIDMAVAEKSAYWELRPLF